MQKKNPGEMDIIYYHLIFIIGLFTEVALEFISKMLNITHLKKRTNDPQRLLKNIFSNSYLTRAHHYIKTKYALSSMKDFFSFYLIIIFIYTFIFIRVSYYFTQKFSSPLLAHLFFIGAVSLTLYFINLPFSIIDTFLIEKKFGFSTITVKTYILDNIKVLILSIILGGILLTIVFSFIIKFQNTWWLLAWAAYTIFSLLMIKIFPTFIAPLFNKFEPIEDGPLKNKIIKMVKKAEFTISRILKNDASKRSKHSNAYFTGFGKNKQIVLFDTLIKKLTPNEITGVLAHEIGHFKKKHIWKMFIIQVMMTGVSLYLVKLFTEMPLFLRTFNLEGTHFITKFIFAVIFINSFFWLLKFPFVFLSRKYEFEADTFSSKITGKSEYLIESLIKLTTDNLSNPYPHPMYSLLFYSHPPLIERIRNLKDSNATIH